MKSSNAALWPEIKIIANWSMGRNVVKVIRREVVSTFYYDEFMYT
jgi:hypothetical protein